MSLESQIEYRRSLKKFFKSFSKKCHFLIVGLRLVLPQIWQLALGRPKAGLQFWKFGFENSKNAFFQKIKMVYAKSALTMLFGMLFLL